jgi:PAS domain S-box-containing protein
VIERTEKIKRSEQQYRHLFHNNPLPMWVIDLSSFKIMDVNNMAILHYGYSRNEFLSMTALDIRPEEDKTVFLTSDHSYITDQTNYNKGKWRHRKKDGSIITVEIIAHEILYKGNKARLILSHDITHQQEAEQKLIRSEANLRAIFENTSEGFVLVDKEGIIKTFNAKAIEYSFFSKENNFQVGHSLFRFIEESREPFFREFFSKVMNGESIHYERSYEDDNGKISWLEFSITPVWDEAVISGACVAGRDITQNKLMEEEMLAQKIQEQRRISRAIIKAQERERNHMGQELHDNVNQILAGTKLYLNMIAKDEASKELIKYPMELIDSAIQEIRSLSSKKVTPIKNINLTELLQKLLADLETRSSVKTSFECNITEHVHDDELKLNIYRIIQEQLNNIMKHASAKTVTVSALAKNRLVHIVITDDGKGFDTTKKRRGIGISNMINRVESFNGTVVIDSSPGKGCISEFKIPY